MSLLYGLFAAISGGDESDGFNASIARIAHLSYVCTTQVLYIWRCKPAEDQATGRLHEGVLRVLNSAMR